MLLAKRHRFTENGQGLELGDGLGNTASALGSYKLYVADPLAGQAGFLGTIRENGKARVRLYHRDTFYSALRRVELGSLDQFRQVHRYALSKHDLLTSGMFAIDTHRSPAGGGYLIAARGFPSVFLIAAGPKLAAALILGMMSRAPRGKPACGPAAEGHPAGKIAAL